MSKRIVFSAFAVTVAFLGQLTSSCVFQGGSGASGRNRGGDGGPGVHRVVYDYSRHSGSGHGYAYRPAPPMTVFPVYY
jgi:hypothetical protein